MKPIVFSSLFCLVILATNQVEAAKLTRRNKCSVYVHKEESKSEPAPGNGSPADANYEGQEPPADYINDPPKDNKTPPAGKKDSPSEKKDSPSEKKDSPSDKKDPPPDRKDPPPEKKDPSSDRKHPPAGKKDPPPDSNANNNNNHSNNNNKNGNNNNNNNGNINNNNGKNNKAGPFEYTVDYGEQNYIDNKDGSFLFNLLPPTGTQKDGQGTRIRSKKTATSGKVCADIKSFSSEMDGPVFAFYVGDDKIANDAPSRNTASWHEIDFEFRGKFPTEYWTNYYYGTLAETGGDTRGSSKPLTDGKARNTNFNKYCMEWNGNGNARWTINDVEVRKATTGKPWRPLYVYISIWAAETNGWNGDMSKFKTATKSEIKNIQFS